MTLQQLFNIELPIIQAPMAGVQGSALAVAVCNAGGMGSLPCAMLSVDAMRTELDAIRAQTVLPFNVNFFCHTAPVPNAAREVAWRRLLAPYYEEFEVDPTTVPAGPSRLPFTSEAADVLADFKPALVSFHFGLPSPDLMARVRSWGAKIISSATTVEEARWLEAQGVDAIIAQGLEAGGHRGIFLTDDLTTQMGTMALLPQIVGAVKVPVIAAGGIADANGVAAAMALGAAGVQIETAYLLCPEATTSAIHRTALKSEAARHTALTNLFTGRPARGIVNRIMKELGPINIAAPRVSFGLGGHRAIARQVREPRFGRFLAALVGPECGWMQGDFRRKINESVGGLYVKPAGPGRTSTHLCRSKHAERHLAGVLRANRPKRRTRPRV